jgi:pimeloyl-ACP methyl ester carboxylesterase
MQLAHLDDFDLEYEIRGTGEPVLFISPVLADGFVPLLDDPQLTSGHQLIHYHRRGWVGSTRIPGPVGIERHAHDAAALLDHLNVARAHVVGHSSGAAVAVQLTLEHPRRVHTLSLLELALLSLPQGQAFLQHAAPVFDAYQAGEHERAFAIFMSAVSGLEWSTVQETLEARAPGVVAQSIKDADTFFGVELPTLAAWNLDSSQAASLTTPVLSVLGWKTLPLWFEVAAFLQANIRDLHEARIDGVGHLLHLQRPEPVAEAIAEFVGRHPIAT